MFEQKDVYEGISEFCREMLDDEKRGKRIFPNEIVIYLEILKETPEFIRTYFPVIQSIFFSTKPHDPMFDDLKRVTHGLERFERNVNKQLWK